MNPEPLRPQPRKHLPNCLFGLVSIFLYHPPFLGVHTWCVCIVQCSQESQYCSVCTPGVCVLYSISKKVNIVQSAHLVCVCCIVFPRMSILFSLHTWCVCVCVCCTVFPRKSILFSRVDNANCSFAPMWCFLC